MARGMWIGQLAATVGITQATVLFYERLGLLPKPPRSRSRYRLYRPGAIKTLRFILAAKRAAFTLEEVKNLLALHRDGADCAAVHAAMTAKVAEVDANLARLTEARETLLAMQHMTAPDAPASEHPIFAAVP